MAFAFAALAAPNRREFAHKLAGDIRSNLPLVVYSFPLKTVPLETRADMFARDLAGRPRQPPGICPVREKQLLLLKNPGSEGVL